VTLLERSGAATVHVAVLRDVTLHALLSPRHAPLPPAEHADMLHMLCTLCPVAAFKALASALLFHGAHPSELDKDVCLPLSELFGVSDAAAAASVRDVRSNALVVYAHILLSAHSGKEKRRVAHTSAVPHLLSALSSSFKAVRVAAAEATAALAASLDAEGSPGMAMLMTGLAEQRPALEGSGGAAIAVVRASLQHNRATLDRSGGAALRLRQMCMVVGVMCHGARLFGYPQHS
jgi:hypothetical protein